MTALNAMLPAVLGLLALVASPAAAQGRFALNPKNPIPDNEISVNIYGYTPSAALGIVCCIVFLIGVVVHSYWFAKFRTTRVFEGLIIFGCLLEIIGYGARLAASKNPFILISFILQYFFIVLSPVWFSAALYWALALIVRSKEEYRRLSPVGPRALIGIFVFFDVATILTQIIGAAFIGASESQSTQGKTPFITPENANNIVIAGLAVQSAAFLVFLLIFFLFVLRLHREGYLSSRAQGYGAGAGTLDRLMFVTLGGTALLIYMRTLFRLAESASGLGSRIATNQTLFGIFESMPIMLSVLWWAAVPLGRFTDAGELGRRGEKAY